MLRLTKPFSIKNKMPRKRNYLGYKLNQNPQVSPYISNEKVKKQEVYDKKNRVLSPHIQEYYGDDLGKTQMLPDDLRREGKIYIRVGQPDIKQAILAQNEYDYDLNSEESKCQLGRRKYYDPYYDKWYEMDGQFLAWPGWHAFSSEDRKKTLEGVTDPRTIVNHVTKWKNNTDKGRWWYHDGRMGFQMDWAYFQSTEHEETWEWYHQTYNKFVLPTHFKDFKFKNQGFYYQWLTKSALFQNVAFDCSETIRKDPFLSGLKETLWSTFQNNHQTWSEEKRKLFYQGDMDLVHDSDTKFLHIKSSPVETRAELVLCSVKNAIQSLNTFSENSEGPLAEQTKTENSVFWYRGAGYQNNQVWEQPHGWQLHARPAYMLKSKSGIRSPISNEGFVNDIKDSDLTSTVPKYNYLSLRKEPLSKSQLDNVPSRLLEEAELNGTHPSHYRIPFTKYENMINSAGDSFRGGDLFPNYQEALLADKLAENPPALEPEFKYADWTFSTIDRLPELDEQAVVKRFMEIGFNDNFTSLGQDWKSLKKYEGVWQSTSKEEFFQNYARSRKIPEEDIPKLRETFRHSLKLQRLYKTSRDLNMRFEEFKINDDERLRRSQNDQAWIAEGLSQCFSSSMGVAHGLGFWWENDVPEGSPIVTNHVLTDGKFLQIFTFELHTVAVDPVSELKELKGDATASRSNVLYASEKYDIGSDNFLDEVMVKALKFPKRMVSGELVKAGRNPYGEMNKVEEEVATAITFQKFVAPGADVQHLQARGVRKEIKKSLAEGNKTKSKEFAE